MQDLRDLVSEKAILSSIFKYGSEAYLDIGDLVQVKSLESNEHQIIYKCLEHICNTQQVNNVDVPNFLSTAKSLGLQDHFESTEQKSYLQSVIKYPCDKSSIRHLSGKVAKLAIARLLDEQLLVCREQLHGISGEETLSSILGLVENPIIDFSSLLYKNENEPEQIFEDIEDYVEFLAKNPVKQVGISTGYKEYDETIGGGLREGTINMIGARAKMGKSSLGLNMGLGISNQEIPCLYLDTEMSKEDQKNRMLAAISTVKIRRIETGQFGNDKKERENLKIATDILKKIPFSYKAIAGQPFEETICEMRRWIHQKVGLDSEKKAKKCVIIFDYLKLMSAESLKNGNLAEFQILGFMMTGLHNFAVKYKIPIVSFVQLNRDGINRADTDVVSGSDRIVWLCSNLAVLRPQSDEEIAQQHGNKIIYNRKLQVIAARHGGGHDQSDYTNMRFDGDICRMTEGPTKFQMESSQNNHHVEGEITNDDSINDIL